METSKEGNWALTDIVIRQKTYQPTKQKNRKKKTEKTGPHFSLSSVPSSSPTGIMLVAEIMFAGDNLKYDQGMASIYYVASHTFLFI